MHNMHWNTQYNTFFLCCLYLCVFKMASNSLTFNFYWKITNFSSSFNTLTHSHSTLTHIQRLRHKYKARHTNTQTHTSTHIHAHTENISTLLVQKFICKMHKCWWPYVIMNCPLCVGIIIICGQSS